jgi:NDP-mannose synthase
MRAVLLAGGKGVRLRPFTTLIPKPLVPIGNEYSILEILIHQLTTCGFDHITICINHMAQLIMAFLGDGSRYGIRIDYSLENEPLNTIGPLTLVENLPPDFLVMNGDILSDLDYGAFYRHHVEQANMVTVSTFKRDSRIDFGVLERATDDTIRGFVEKPTYHFEVSMGVYCINRAVIQGLTRGKPYGFDHLMLDGIKSGAEYKAKTFSGLWLDIGRPEDYDYCNENYFELKSKLHIP